MDAVARIDIVSDAICPWCYIGKRHLEGALKILQDEGQTFAIAWRPYQLNPDMPEGGVARADYRARKFGSAARAAELDSRITQSAAQAGLAFRTDLMRRTPNTVAAHRLAAFALEQGFVRQDAIVEAMFRGYFVEGLDIGSHEVLTDLAVDASFDREEVARFLASGEGTDDIRAEDASFRRAGLNGVPTFAMRGHVLFSGAMPADAMADAFRSAWAVLNKAAA